MTKNHFYEKKGPYPLNEIVKVISCDNKWWVEIWGWVKVQLWILHPWFSYSSSKIQFFFVCDSQNCRFMWFVLISMRSKYAQSIRMKILHRHSMCDMFSQSDSRKSWDELKLDLKKSRFSLIFTDFCGFALISVGFHWFSLERLKSNTNHLNRQVYDSYTETWRKS